jgi:hypothetical protein
MASYFANQSKRLVAQLNAENPEIASAVKGFLSLDKIARKLGFIDETESFAAQVTWMPVISILGTFSAGKSTFLNTFLGEPLQRTGNQAVDDKFTVVMHSPDPQSVVLPGSALDSDPRFPMYRITEALEEAHPGEGERVNAYVQLKTTRSEKAKGRIFVDSPGFDADEERDAILRLAQYVVEISDLVLVLFDARHPEPGAMRNTLEHLVTGSKERNDTDKCLYILNQIDVTAREDNPEEVFAAWQRGVADAGLRHGRFYRIYDDSAAVPIDDEELEQRFRRKRDEDLGEIHNRIEQVTVDRAYRIASMLGESVTRVRTILVPALESHKSKFIDRVRRFDLLIAIAAIGGGLFWYLQKGISLGQGRLIGIIENPWPAIAITVLAVLFLVFMRVVWVRFCAERALASCADSDLTKEDNKMLRRALGENLGFLSSLIRRRPSGLTSRRRRHLVQLLERTDEVRRRLNDRFAKADENVGAV